MPTKTLRSAADAYETQLLLAAAAVRTVQRLRAPNARSIAEVVAAYQLLAAQQAVSAVPAMLAEQGVSAPAVGTAGVSLLAGVASNGYPLEPMVAKTLTGESVAFRLGRFVGTMVADAGRQGGALARYTRPQVTGYVRMLNPPSCSRCVILAGRWYPNEGGVRFVPVGTPNGVRYARDRTGDGGAFQRHPQCDCIMIPASEDGAGDLTTDPSAYFDSLDEATQDETFGKAAAQAIRDGADMAQVVNAYDGVSEAQIYGREALVTSVGTTSRGVFGRANAQRANPLPYRLMPETIYEVARDRDDALRLLRLYGYIL